MMTDNTVVTSSSFYTSCEQTDNSSLVYNNADVNDLLVSTSSGAHAPPSHLENIATSPHLDSGNELEQLCPFRLRSHSAPSVLHEQVALQLRDISDEFNQEYSRDEAVEAVQRPQRQDRRRSLPDIHRHEPHQQNWLHNMIQSFRCASNAPSRSHNSSISRVSEESSDTEDELDQVTT